MCAKKNILRIIRAFINLMSAHSYKLTIYCIQSTHSAEGWGQSGAACSSVPSSKIKNIRFSMTQTGSESEATQICMDARALLPSRERKKLSRHVHWNKRPPHVRFRWMKKWKNGAGIWAVRVTLKCSQQKCSGIITLHSGNIRRRLMAVISCSNLCSNIKKT